MCVCALIASGDTSLIFIVTGFPCFSHFLLWLGLVLSARSNDWSVFFGAESLFSFDQNNKLQDPQTQPLINERVIKDLYWLRKNSPMTLMACCTLNLTFYIINLGLLLLNWPQLRTNIILLLINDFTFFACQHLHLSWFTDSLESIRRQGELVLAKTDYVFAMCLNFFDHFKNQPSVVESWFKPTFALHQCIGVQFRFGIWIAFWFNCSWFRLWRERGIRSIKFGTDFAIDVFKTEQGLHATL